MITNTGVLSGIVLLILTHALRRGIITQK